MPAACKKFLQFQLWYAHTENMKSLHVEIKHKRHFISDQTVQPSQVE